ncbi:hypothetical protein EMIT0P294_11169 [Pseudomonas sp. IT-P294]
MYTTKKKRPTKAGHSKPHKQRNQSANPNRETLPSCTCPRVARQ